jgi:hypothetical protein
MTRLLRSLVAGVALLAGAIPVARSQVPPPIPSLPDSERRTAYNISASQCSCAIGFALFEDGTDIDAQISVWINGVAYHSTDVSHGWGLTSATGPLGSIARPITNAVLTFTAAQTGTIQIVGAQRPRRPFQFTTTPTVRDFNQALTYLTAAERERWDLNQRELRGLPGENINPIPSAAARASGVLGFDSGGQPTTLSPLTGLGTMVGPNISKAGNVVSWNSTNGTLTADGGALAASITKTIEDYGASTAGTGAANLTAIQSAFDSTPNGGTIKIDKPGYQVAGILTISKNIRLLCANRDVTVAAHLTQATVTSDLLHIRSGYVTIEGCTFNLAGSPSGSATGIKLGDDALSVSATFNGTTTLNCGTCTFTSADVGKRV